MGREGRRYRAIFPLPIARHRIVEVPGAHIICTAVTKNGIYGLGFVASIDFFADNYCKFRLEIHLFGETRIPGNGCPVPDEAAGKFCKDYRMLGELSLALSDVVSIV